MKRLTKPGSIISQKDINELMELSDKNQFGQNDAYYKLKKYEDLEELLETVYGECDGLLEIVVKKLVQHEGAEFKKPVKARLLTDEDVDKWDKLKNKEDLKKGKWIGTFYDGYADGFPVYEEWVCSVCGEEYESEGEPPAFKFCPNCGADMNS